MILENSASHFEEPQSERNTRKQENPPIQAKLDPDGKNRFASGGHFMSSAKSPLDDLRIERRPEQKPHSKPGLAVAAVVVLLVLGAAVWWHSRAGRRRSAHGGGAGRRRRRRRPDGVERLRLRHRAAGGDGFLQSHRQSHRGAHRGRHEGHQRPGRGAAG